MSWKPLVYWTKKPKPFPHLNTTDKAVLITLASYTGREDKCFPSVDTIAKTSWSSRSSVIRSLDKLSECGLIARNKRYNKSTIYTIVSGVSE